VKDEEVNGQGGKGCAGPTQGGYPRETLNGEMSNTELPTDHHSITLNKYI